MMNPSVRNCEGISRRDILRIGSIAPLGMGMVEWFQRRAVATEVIPVRAKSCIMLWLDGGPSHLETFDLKSNAPAEVRGPFKPISTNVSGIEVSEHLTSTSKICDRLAIIRSMTSPLGEHGLANRYLLTGYKPSPVLQYPSYGSVLSHTRGHPSVLPAYVSIPESRLAGAGFLGGAVEPFVTGGDPSRADFRVRDLDFFPGVDEERIRRRRDFLKEFDAVQAKFEGRALPSDRPFDQAYRLVTSQDAKRAFKLNDESPQVRARYGPKMFGQSCLLARRLVERGVPFVSVMNTGWDTHENLSLQLKEGYSGAKVGVGLVPTFDQAFSALVTDLSERGMLDETLVIAMGEFGRTPKINPRGGRDHWPRVFSVVLAGGGVAGGQIVGSSDAMGESPLDNPITPSDLARTIYWLLGVDPDLELHTPEGRPVPVNQGGRLIREILRA